MRAWGGCASSARAAAAAQHVKSATILLPVPQLASLASCGRLSRRLASLRTSVSGCGGPLAAPPPPRHILGTSQWAAPSRNGKLRCCCQCVPTSLILQRLTPRLQAGDTRRPQRSQDLTLRPTLHDRADAQHDQHYGHRGRRTRGDRGRGGRCGRRGGGGRGRGRGGRTRVALALRAALNGAHLTHT